MGWRLVVLLVVIAILGEGRFASAQGFSTQEACDEAVRKAIEALVESDVNKLVHILYSEEPAIPEEMETKLEATAKDIQKQRNSWIARLGEPVEVAELVKTEKISDRIIRYSILEYYERGAIVHRYVFYRGRNRWIPYGMEWHTDLSPYFETVPR